MWALLEVTKNGKIGPEDVGIVQLGRNLQMIYETRRICIEYE